MLVFAVLAAVMLVGALVNGLFGRSLKGSLPASTSLRPQ